MSRTFLFLLLIGAILFWWHWENTPEPEQRKQLLWKTGMGALIIITVLLVVTGKMHWLGAVFAGFLAYLRQGLALWLRYFPMLTHLYRTHAPVSETPNISTVNTPLIEMKLNHATGKLSGKVLAGEFKGSQLDAMSYNQLVTFCSYCSSHDPDSLRLLESYLVARFGETPRSRAEGQYQTAAAMTTDMTVAEALQVLGLSGNPSREEITLAYRKIMQQLHPDRGGNEYFAAKANQARDILLHKVS
jgi:hypothetical protein